MSNGVSYQDWADRFPLSKVPPTGDDPAARRKAAAGEPGRLFDGLTLEAEALIVSCVCDGTEFMHDATVSPGVIKALFELYQAGWVERVVAPYCLSGPGVAARYRASKVAKIKVMAALTRSDRD
jgi:hypothetical protein